MNQLVLLAKNVNLTEIIGTAEMGVSVRLSKVYGCVKDRVAVVSMEEREKVQLVSFTEDTLTEIG